MSEFGNLLRNHRESCHDPLFPARKLSQARLGEILGNELGTQGYSGAAVSDWERGKSKIHADDRRVLMAMIKVLYEAGGLKTMDEADQLLEAGNYRALGEDEKQKIFKESTNNKVVKPSAPEEENPKSFIPFLPENLFSVSQKELQDIIAKAKDGPSPLWPRVLAAFMRKAFDRISISLTTIGWIWVWLVAWWLITPSLRLTYANHHEILLATEKYVIGTLIVPLMIGLLIDTKNNEYWEGQSAVKPILLRLYTYQGAGIGFNLGYFFVFPLALIRYYLHLESTIWIKILAVTLGLILGNMAARVVPYNLWRVYGRLTFADGGIFFVVALLGPLWGFFFLEFYPILLAPILGGLVILLAVTILISLTTKQSKNHTQ